MSKHFKGSKNMNIRNVDNWKGEFKRKPKEQI